jgi:hypothetical protein
MAEVINAKYAILEMDFIANAIVQTSKIKVNQVTQISGIPTYKIKKDLVDRFKTEILGEVWHTESDNIEYIIIYSDGTANVQRRKQNYNFTTKQTSWKSYVYKGYTAEDVSVLSEKIEQFIEATRLVNRFQIDESITSISQEYTFWDTTLTKRLGEKNQMLAASDWRMLPDVEDNYDGEKDNWILWRSKIRNIAKEYFSNDALKELEANFDIQWYKDLYNLKWPMDPVYFAKTYPDRVESDGSLTGYLETDDCWVERDTDASTDLIMSRITNISELSAKWSKSRRIVSEHVKEMMQLMKVEEFVENGIDYTKIYTQEEIDALGEE